MKSVVARIYDIMTNDPHHLSTKLIMSDGREQDITYGLFWKQSCTYAQALVDAGVSPGEVVVCIFRHSPDLLYAFGGGLLSGAIPSIFPFRTMKLDPHYYRSTVRSLCEISRVAAILTSPDLRMELESLLQHVGSLKAIISDSSFELSNGPCGGYVPSDRLLSDPDRVVLLQHSSGTTGLQKGVALSSKAILNQVEGYSKAIELQASDVVVSWLPLYHDMGLIAGFLMPLLTGTRLVLMSPFDWVRSPHLLFDCISRFQGSLVWLPNFAYNFCARKTAKEHMQGVDLSSLRAVINCSEPVFEESHEMFLRRFGPYGLRENALVTCYAMAENTFAITQGPIGEPYKVDYVDRHVLAQQGVAVPVPPSDQSAKAIVSCGLPIAGVKTIILDASLREVPERSVGEIGIRSNCMLSEYFLRPDITELAFHNGWLLTGDLGYTVDGELYVCGRRKDLIIVGGVNYHPQDMEAIADEVQGVYPGRTAAFGVGNPETGTEDIVIVAELDPCAAVAPSSIEAAIRQQIAIRIGCSVADVRLVPRQWLIKTSSGKIARNASREKYLRTQSPRRR